MKSYDVVCIGQTCVDILMRGFPDQLYFEGERCTVSDIGMNLGGDAANEAMALTAMGYNTALVSPVGKDTVADFIRVQLREAGICTDYMQEIFNAATPLSAIFVEQNGERKIALGADSVYYAQSMDFPYELLEGAKVISLASFFLQPLLDVEKIEAFCKKAKEMGRIICADLRAKPEIRFEDYRKIMPYIDYIFPNQDEAYYYSGAQTPEQAADYFLNLGIKNVIVKTGSKGCLAKNDHTCVQIPSYLTVPVDTTGAGDNFAAGFISGILDGKSIDDCCRRACAAARVAVESVGAFGVIKSKEQLEQIIEAAAQ